MARRRFVFFPNLQPVLGWLGWCCLGLLLALLLAAPGTKSLAQTHADPSQLIQQGRERYEAGRYAEAAALWHRAAQVFGAQDDHLNQAMSLSNFSLAEQQLGQWPEATQAISESLQLLEARAGTQASNERLKVLAQALNTQASLQLALGQAETALGTWQQATTAYQQAGDGPGKIRSLINQAQALQSLGLYRRALATLEQANQDLKQTADSSLKASSLLSLGHALRVVGDLNQARQSLQQSLGVAQRLSDRQAIAQALFSLGNVVRAQQEPEAALRFYAQAASESQDSATQLQAQLNQLSLLVEGRRWSEAQALWPRLQAQVASWPLSRTAVYARIDLAQSLSALKQAQVANGPAWLDIARLLATAVEQAKTLGDTRSEAYALGNLGNLYEQTQQWAEAQKLTEKALLLAQTINASDIAYQWQWQLGRLLKTQGKTSAAVAAYSEAVDTLRALRNDLVAVNPEVQFSFRDQVEPIYRQLVDLLLQTEGNAQPEPARLAQARTVIESLQLAELDNFFRVACLEAKPVLVDQVVEREDPTAAVFYPIILPDRLEVILKLPHQALRHYKTQISQTEVEKTVDDLRRQLTKPYTLREVQTLSAKVYDWLLRPAATELARSQVKTLVFVLDGSLRNIPMATLYDGQQYLVQNYGVALAPSLQLLDPKPLEQRSLKALIAGLSEARHGFSQLDYVRQELAAIQSEVPAQVFLNRDFTETALQTQIQASPFPIVHLATHGQFSSKAEETFILAWDKAIEVNELDSFLRNRGQSRPNAIELLVLSACQTATGDRRAALGLAGMAVRAGARSTLASLWYLDDESSALLMGQFYQQLSQSRQTKAAALRQAQLTLLQIPRYQHPRYWAPYVLVGNWL
ncbi:CHAT domain-containing protein [Leptolyngbya sp. FACHB-261]|uniref:CHAT domain-containing protein n=1 Tax=Leptolyngbya sp. FACHB-261 TaxID=2692806 RepID=UPI001689D569|nr:CHAT domain-containing protein [Leptolyngbya sp. FACHB-261]MBD2102813.1 CHAT domain-containing protein [Leptolyngbya sp. FACHB-261]